MCLRYPSVAASIAPFFLYSSRPMLCSPCSTLKRKYRLSSKCLAHLAINLFSVFSVSVAILTTVWLRNLITLSSNAFVPGFPVPIEIKHLTEGFKSPVSEHHILQASPSTSSTGLFAPNPPSANERSPMLTDSKKVVAADVARAASHIVARILGS
jgi:hypothetical protein